jgi:hypothetical protein
MMADRPNRLAVAFARETARATNAKLCTVCVDVLEVTGAGITVMGGDQAGPICVSDSRVAGLEDLQFTVGAGPCRDAFRSRVSVHAPQLDADASARWPAFVDLARASDIAAVFAYPLLVAGANVGVLTLYQHDEGELTPTQLGDSDELAEILAETILSLQDDAPAGTLAGSLDEAVRYRAEIYQASGMISIQMSIPADEALLRLRAYAFANDQPLGDVAALVVARRLRLPNDHTDQPLD